MRRERLIRGLVVAETIWCNMLIFSLAAGEARAPHCSGKGNGNASQTPYNLLLKVVRFTISNFQGL